MWFDASTGNLIGAVLGTTIGLLGGAWGTLAGISASKGKRRGLVLNMAKIMTAAGVLSCIAGCIALFMDQPYHVWYPFLAIGAWPAVFFPFIYRAVKKVYTKSELKKMSVDELK